MEKMQKESNVLLGLGFDDVILPIGKLEYLL